MPWAPPVHGHSRISKKIRRPDPFYASKPWRTLRRWFLRRNPLCVDPFRAHGGQPVEATVVDHIAPRTVAPEKELVMSNLRSLCASCHNRITRSEQLRHG